VFGKGVDTKKGTEKKYRERERKISKKKRKRETFTIGRPKAEEIGEGKATAMYLGLTIKAKYFASSPWLYNVHREN